MGALKPVLSNRGLGIKSKKCLYEGLIVPTVLYGAKAWGMRSAEIEKKLASRADWRVLRWFAYVERMDEYRGPEGCRWS